MVKQLLNSDGILAPHQKGGGQVLVLPLHLADRMQNCRMVTQQQVLQRKRLMWCTQ